MHLAGPAEVGMLQRWVRRPRLVCAPMLLIMNQGRSKIARAHESLSVTKMCSLTWNCTHVSLSHAVMCYRIWTRCVVVRAVSDGCFGTFFIQRCIPVTPPLVVINCLRGGEGME